MNWISLILWVLTNIPTIIKIVKFIISLINKIEDKTERREASRELALAVKKAKETGDDKELRNLMLKLSRRSGAGG